MRWNSLHVRWGRLAILLTACIAITGRTQTLPGWTLRWSDEFNQADGSPPSITKWNYEIGDGCPDLCGWGNGELQYYTSRTNNARIEGGNLVIEAHKEDYQGRNYTSARLVTKNKRGGSWTYGRMEARIKIPRGQGIWPAFWMLGTDIDTVGWPDCGEIDIMENVGFEPRTVHGTVHGPFSGGGHYGFGDSYVNPADLADDFHVYAVEWEADAIRWYLDDTHYFTATPSSVPGSWVFDHKHFFLLNIAVGGNWPGYPDETTSFPQQMLVDYVRVYSAIAVQPFTLTAIRAGNGIQISFPTQGNVNYEVMYKVDPAEPTWTPIETITGDGTLMSVTYPTTEPGRYYSVRTP